MMKRVLVAILGAFAEGVTTVSDAGELRVKESDRIAVMANGLRKLGVELQEYPDGIDISGGQVTGGRVESAGDHRCAMSFAVLGLVASGRIQIENAQYIATSYPGFTRDMRRLGADMQVDGTR